MNVLSVQTAKFTYDGGWLTHVHHISIQNLSVYMSTLCAYCTTMLKYFSYKQSYSVVYNAKESLSIFNFCAFQCLNLSERVKENSNKIEIEVRMKLLFGIGQKCLNLSVEISFCSAHSYSNIFVQFQIVIPFKPRLRSYWNLLKNFTQEESKKWRRAEQ